MMRGLVLGGLLGLPHTKISLGGKNRSFFINRDSTLECKNVQLRGKSHSRLSVSKLVSLKGTGRGVGDGDVCWGVSGAMVCCESA